MNIISEQTAAVDTAPVASREIVSLGQFNEHKLAVGQVETVFASWAQGIPKAPPWAVCSWVGAHHSGDEQRKQTIFHEIIDMNNSKGLDHTMSEADIETLKNNLAGAALQSLTLQSGLQEPIQKEERPELKSRDIFFSYLHKSSKNEIRKFINSLAEESLPLVASLLYIKESSSKEDIMKAAWLRSFRVGQENSVDITNVDVEEIVRAAFSEDPVSLDRQGLHNNEANCFLNSAVQCLRDNIENLSKEQKEEIISNIRKEFLLHLPEDQRDSCLAELGSPLAAFLEKRFDANTPAAAGLLRQEIYRLIKNSNSKNPLARDEMIKNIDYEAGTSRIRSDPLQALLVFFEAVKYPCTTFKKIDDQESVLNGLHTVAEEQQKIQQQLLVLDPLELGESTSIHSLLEEYLKQDRYVQDLNGKNYAIHSQLQLMNPPLSFTICFKRCKLKPPYAPIVTRVTGITDDVFFSKATESSLVSSEKMRYTPISIACIRGGHGFLYRKINNQWISFDDKKTTFINLADEYKNHRMTHRQIMESGAYFIGYKLA